MKRESEPGKRRAGWRAGCLVLAVLAVAGVAGVAEGAAEKAGEAGGERSPNVVVIFLDDSGWADFRPFGTPSYATPNVERLAAEGTRFTRFYVPQAVCSASRAALMTGCYPERVKVFGAHPPEARGLDPQFATLGEVVQGHGYATAVFGKWHLGDQAETRPPARGFGESAGLMYSNDMWEFHPEKPEYWGQWPLRFWENGQVKIERVTREHQPYLTRWYTEHAVDFIRRHRDGPFFLYVPHSMPHVPIFASEAFQGKSGAGLYGDVILELDWSVGEILRALRESGVEENTLVMLTSDNGPWHSYGNHAGKTPFREAKGTSFDGGVRSACLVKWPGRMAAGAVSERTWGSIDLLPTVARVTGAPLPENPIDGKDVWDWIRGEAGAENPHAYYAFTTGADFEAVMSGDGRWKLHVEHAYRTLITPGRDGSAGKFRQEKIGPALFDLENDPEETREVQGEFPEVAARLARLAEAHRKQWWGEEGKETGTEPAGRQE